MYLSLISFAMLSLGAAVVKVSTSSEVNRDQQGLEELKLSDGSPWAKYEENMRTLSNQLHAPLLHLAKPEAERKDATEMMMQTLVELDEPLVQGAPSAPPSSLISSKRSTDVSSSLSGDMDLVSGIDLSWGKTSKPSASIASMSQQNSYVAPARVAGHVNPYLEGIDFNLPKPAASMIKQSSYLSTVKVHSALKTKKIQRALVVDVLDQSKLKGALDDWLSAKKPAEQPVVHEQQQEQKQFGKKEDPMAMDTYNAWAHNS